jgi:hypothetical protein
MFIHPVLFQKCHLSACIPSESCVSVSQSQIDIVKNYLRNKETHHQKRTFNQECDDLIQKFGFEKYKDLD